MLNFRKIFSDWSLKTAKIGFCTPLKLNTCYWFVSEAADMEHGIHIAKSRAKFGENQ